MAPEVFKPVGLVFKPPVMVVEPTLPPVVELPTIVPVVLPPPK